MFTFETGRHEDLFSRIIDREWQNDHRQIQIRRLDGTNFNMHLDFKQVRSRSFAGRFRIPLFLKPADFRFEDFNPVVQFIHRKQRQIAADIMLCFLFRLIIIKQAQAAFSLKSSSSSGDPALRGFNSRLSGVMSEPVDTVV